MLKPLILLISLLLNLSLTTHSQTIHLLLNFAFLFFKNSVFLINGCP